MKMTIFNTGKAQPPTGPYSHGSIVGRVVYTAGQIGMAPDGRFPQTMEEQAAIACGNVGAILEEAGSSFEHVFKVNCFLADMADFAAFNAVYARYFITAPPRTCVAVKGLPAGALCEIEAEAVIPEVR